MTTYGEAALSQTTQPMLLHIRIAALLLQVVQPSQPQVAASPRSAEMRTDAAGYAVMHFLGTWRSAWLESVGWRGSGTTFIRLRDVHCHWDGSYGVAGYYRSANGSGAHGGPPPPNLIHRSSRRSMCPDWYPVGESIPDDERLLLDISLAPSVRDRTRLARARPPRLARDLRPATPGRRVDHWTARPFPHRSR